MYTQRIQQMQNAMQRRPEVPGVSQARHQGQAMSSVQGAGVNALKKGLGATTQGVDPNTGGRLAGQAKAAARIWERRNRVPGKPQTVSPGVAAMRKNLTSG